MALPTKNLTFDAIRNVLNATGGSVTNEVATAFKSTSGINKFSRNKPESYKADFIEGGGSPKEKNNFGLRILGNYSSLSSLFAGQSNVWQYILPTGGVNSPYRLGDFCGYEMYGQPPLMSYIPTELKSNGMSGLGQNYKTAFVMHFNGNSYPNNYWTSTGSIGIQELKDSNSNYLYNLYPGVAIRWKTGTNDWKYCWVTSAQKISANLQSIPIVLDIGETPFATLTNVSVEVSFGFFSAMSGTEYDTSVHACHLAICQDNSSALSGIATSAETSLNANKKSFTVTKEDAKLGLNYKITAGYTVSSGQIKVTSFSVVISLKDSANKAPTLSFRPYGLVSHGDSGTVVQKWIATSNVGLNIQTINHDYWINNNSKTLTWSSTDLDAGTFSGLGSPIRNLTLTLAAGTSSQLSGSILGDYTAHSINTSASTDFTTGNHTITG